MRIHFISIGGVAMHNLAIALHKNGNHITGSDDGIFDPSYSKLQKYALLPSAIGWFPEKITTDIDAVILGMHALPENPELLEAQKKQIRIYSYPEFLYEHSKDKTRVVIGGSHGKTTITSMIVHVLKQANVDADYMIGGQLQGFDEMVKLTKTAKYMIFEGDEFPTSPLDSRSKFLHYHPHIAVISGIAWDHVDVFPDYENYIDTFCLFLQDINSEGCLIYNHDDQELMRLSKEINARKIAYFPHQYKTEQGITIISDNAENDYPLNIFGLHNMANLSAARLVCKELGVSDEVFYTAISGFQGASLRMELLATKGKSFIYRDFAHSAPELKAAVHALRQQYPEHRLIISYELQCYSSMSELYIDHYSGTLDLADEAIVFYDPKSANNKKIPLMTNGRIKQGFSRMDLHLFSESADMLKYLKTLTKDNFVLGFLTCGRYGGIDIPAVAMEFIESLKS